MLSSFNHKGFYYSYAWSRSLCERRTSFCTGLISRKLCRFLLMYSTGFISLSVLLLFSSINHLLHLHARFLILFYLTQMRFSQYTHLLFLSLETSTTITRTGLPNLVEQMDLVNSVIILPSQMTLLGWLIFLLRFQTVILIVLLFWIHFFLLRLVSLHSL